MNDHREPELPPAVEAERRDSHGPAGRIAYYVAGSGSPVLMLHSINAAASAREVTPLFEHLRQRFRVYAPDLPGFGHSERSDRRYHARLYVDAVLQMLDSVAAEVGDEPVLGVAISLSAEFLARAAVEQPERLGALALITPTGFQKGAHRLRGEYGSTKELPRVHGFLANGRVGRGLFALLTREKVIRYFLQRTFGRKDVPADLVAYDRLTARQPGAHRAPVAFLTGALFSRDVRDVYERLSQPVWLAHGTRGDFRDFSEADWVRERENWRIDAFDTGALPHFEIPDRFLPQLEAFLDRHRGTTSAP